MRLQPRAKTLLHEMAEGAHAPLTRTRAGRWSDSGPSSTPSPRRRSRSSRAIGTRSRRSSTSLPSWRHLRTTNPIESSFATVKLCTRVTKGAGSKKGALAMAYKPLDAAHEDETVAV